MKSIRCSSLPAWGDCARRTAARSYADDLKAHGFELIHQLPSVGAAVGTAVHKAASHFLEARRDKLREPTQNECSAEAEASLVKSLAPGAIWDATTPNMLTAAKQIDRMIASFWPLWIELDPQIVEQKLEATIAPGWIMSGHPDFIGADGCLKDFKTGVPERNHIVQLGGYALLSEANGVELETATVDFVKRVRLKTPQPPPVVTPYDLNEAKLFAWRAIQEIIADVTRFEASGNPHEFNANPMSLMCSEKYCPVRETSFCKIQKGE